ncbi:MAG TPA: hypothetical protein VMH86_04650 [Rhizomicrobium sp.]|nr:hypothetical protein [Rhizomicrobium sp.]
MSRKALKTAAGAVLLGATIAGAAGATAYSRMAPLDRYLMDPAAEIALARSAAPPSISGKATVLVLTRHGYETAVKGSNGYVCLVDRTWFAEFDNPIFWNPVVRGPDCLNPAAVRGMLPHYIERTKWALAGLSIAQMSERTRAEIAAKTYVLPEPGAMSFMMSKQQILGEQGTHWHPHLMFFVANVSDDAFGANYDGSPVLHPYASAPDPIATFLVPVGKWSDGTPAMAMH